MSELLPCPFCGGEADEYEGDYGNGIYCMQCGAMVGEPIHLGFNVAERVSYEQAVEAWNTRHHFGLTDEDYNILLDEMGVSERTCKFVSSKGSDYPPVCSECGYELGIYDCAWYEDSTYGYERNYCPNCGAKVVKE